MFTYVWAVPKILVTTGRPSMPSKATVLNIAESIQTLQASCSFAGRLRCAIPVNLDKGSLSLDSCVKSAARWL